MLPMSLSRGLQVSASTADWYLDRETFLLDVADWRILAIVGVPSVSLWSSSALPIKWAEKFDASSARQDVKGLSSSGVFDEER
mmetsp:Transcript_10158/g.28510  ORF Transcript_10158/g.28510 Transcript_10158/m.28510 type:complete len:83 (+) Transcript_10158:1407-1655(+)